MSSSSNNNGSNNNDVNIYSPCPGLVCVEQLCASSSSPYFPLDDNQYDPVYALQTLPNAKVCTAPSIKGLAKEVYNALLSSPQREEEEEEKTTTIVNNGDIVQQFRKAKRGTLSIHALVPGMFKGQKNPIMKRRVDTITQELSVMMKKSFAAARPSNDESGDSNDEIDKWLLQVLLANPEVVICTLSKCIPVGPTDRPQLLPTTTSATTDCDQDQNIVPGSSTATNKVGSLWPNWIHPAGLAYVELEGSDVPSSAYRKLMEALECMQCRPPPAATSVKNTSSSMITGPYVVDLGACPGGWTAVMRRMGCKVIAVDRSELASNLMEDDMVHFIKGDAFTFDPTTAAATTAAWMVSDVIAYPERVAELLETWCSNKWADYMVITVKFQGDKPAWSELNHAIHLAKSNGYNCRAKHFFNNKNEVTLMVSKKEDTTTAAATIGGGISNVDGKGWGLLGKAMYEVALPLTNASSQ
mmetsp:Transcript_24883/g.36494  ORF Transcript_24883/g.36494 Transcript_24883/m.36494 type:complete len:470 (+) Transcript_24883:3-1412(+)